MCATETSCQSVLCFFNDTATTEIYTLSLHDALPIFQRRLLRDQRRAGRQDRLAVRVGDDRAEQQADRKSTRLNSSHANISYAVFCLKKKNPRSRTVSGSPRITGSPHRNRRPFNSSHV